MIENKERALEELRKLEPYRLEFLKKIKKQFFYIFICPLFITIPCGIIAIYLHFVNINNPFLMPCTIIGGCSLFFILFPILIYLDTNNNGYNKKFKEEIKKVVFPLILSDFGDIKYIEKKRKNKIIPKSQIEECGLFSFADNKSVDDVFFGFYNNMPFKISEIDLYREVYTGHASQCYHSFKGMLLSIKLNQNKNTTLITTTKDVEDKNKNLAIQLGAILLILATHGYIAYLMYESVVEAIRPISIGLLIAIMLASYILVKYYMSKKKGIKKPKNEFLVTEETRNVPFYVYTDTLIESTQTTYQGFLAKLVEFRNNLNGTNIRCSIYGNNLMVAVDTDENLFEIGDLKEPLTNPHTLDDFYNQMNAIYDFIDYIKNNEELN